MQLKGIKTAKILAGTLLGLVGLWLFACLLLFSFPSPAAPVPGLDAVVVLGGSSEERLPVAQQYAKDSGAHVLAVSWTDTPGNVSADSLCQQASFPSSSLVCFRPPGMDTRGEAEVIGSLVKANGWSSIAVVTSSYHVPRAETLVRQCTDAAVTMVASDPRLSPGQWLRRYAIETGGLLDVFLRPECAPKHE